MTPKEAHKQGDQMKIRIHKTALAVLFAVAVILPILLFIHQWGGRTVVAFSVIAVVLIMVWYHIVHVSRKLSRVVELLETANREARHE